VTAHGTGSVEIAVIRKVPTPTQLTDKYIADLVGHALNQEQATGDWQVAIAFVDSIEMRMLHEQFMNDRSPTDILTFPYDEPGISGGDIAICVGLPKRSEPSSARHSRTSCRS
jgi:ssRNA-specific RNase YbeY (16S rRNA maturation enzyme)